MGAEYAALAGARPSGSMTPEARHHGWRWRATYAKLHNASASCATFAAAGFPCYADLLFPGKLAPVVGPVIFLLICSRRA
jgi:hypothetical protein